MYAKLNIPKEPAIVPFGVPVVAQWLTNPTRNHEVAGSVPALAQWVNDPALLWAEVADAAWIPSCCGSGVGQWLQLRFDPYPGNLHMPWERPKEIAKKKRQKKKGIIQIQNQRSLLLWKSNFKIWCSFKMFCSWGVSITTHPGANNWTVQTVNVSYDLMYSKNLTLTVLWFLMGSSLGAFWDAAPRL